MSHSSATVYNTHTGKGEKTLLIIRHAKSSWDIGTLRDFDRPLNDRGKKDAPMMAKRLIAKNIVIDAFLSSPAKRAKKTAELFREAYEEQAGEILFQPKLYHAGVEDFFEAVSQLDDSFKTVAIFSHNPGITAFINELTDEVQIDNMPTCGIFAVAIQTNRWTDFITAKKNFLFLITPNSPESWTLNISNGVPIFYGKDRFFYKIFSK